MSGFRSWLTTSYTANTYESDDDNDILIARRRKALEELSGILRQKWLKQIDLAMKQE